MMNRGSSFSVFSIQAKTRIFGDERRNWTRKTRLFSFANFGYIRTASPREPALAHVLPDRPVEEFRSSRHFHEGDIRVCKDALRIAIFCAAVSSLFILVPGRAGAG
jgi:hypothetical protein